MISVLPQLPCENRYTVDWIKVWERELKKLDVPFQMVDPRDPYFPLAKVTKYFTDPVKALAYEANQIQLLCNDPPDKIFCLDVEFPGLVTPAIQALRLVNPDLKAYGYLHAGSWCSGDVWDGTKGRRHLDRMVFDTFDKVFVATNYHKKKIQHYFGERFDNLVVVGFPFYREDVYTYAKPLPFKEKKTVVVNGRWEQSNLPLLDKLKKKLNIEFYWIASTGRKGYYEHLNQAKVVLSLKTEETFGIGQLEAYVLGGIPLCPNKFAYPEVIGDERLLYDDEDDLADKLANLLKLDHDPWSCLRVNCLQHPDIEKYEQTIARCVRMMK